MLRTPLTHLVSAAEHNTQVVESIFYELSRRQAFIQAPPFVHFPYFGRFFNGFGVDVLLSLYLELQVTTHFAYNDQVGRGRAGGFLCVVSFFFTVFVSFFFTVFGP